MGFLSITEPIPGGMGNQNLSLVRLLDRVAHDSFLEKLRTFGISDKWFKNYPTDSVQVVKVGNAVFKPRPVCRGVPQGFILGSLFLKLYVNDVPKEIWRMTAGTHAAGYADDTQMRISASSKTFLPWFKTTCNGIVATRQNFGGLGLKVNTAKTQIMICGGRHTLSCIDTPPGWHSWWKTCLWTCHKGPRCVPWSTDDVLEARWSPGTPDEYDTLLHIPLPVLSNRARYLSSCWFACVKQT